MQKKIFLDELLQKKANLKYSLCFYFEYNSNNTVQENIASICSLINLYPELCAKINYDGKSVNLNSGNPFTQNDVAVDDLNDANVNFDKVKNAFFHMPINLFNNEKLIALKLLYENDHYTLLVKVHHIIFDFYSFLKFKKDFYKQIILQQALTPISEQTQNEIKASIIHADNKDADTIKKYYQRKTKNEFYPSVIIGSTSLSNFKCDQREIILANQQPNLRSAIVLVALAKAIFEMTNIDRLMIGVPVPNRKLTNRKLISCFVNIMPIIIKRNEVEHSEQILNDVQQQLYMNLKYSHFDFTSNFSKYAPFNVTFSYYPNNKNKQTKTKTRILNMNSVTEIHITYDDLNQLTIETQLYSKSTFNVFCKKIHDNMNSLNVDLTTEL
ncbi:hypothetical protein [Apilactobacillus quenuiae]|uniref:hypothetical protein n=1 Tax=Apilactobacillus quenuiae TaxID=2008377 RepID=UPI000D01CE0D|nr:hypothetical protein [Apilactobacillus quenuiae]